MQRVAMCRCVSPVAAATHTSTHTETFDFDFGLALYGWYGQIS